MKQFFSNKIVRFVVSAGIAAGLFWACPPCLNHWILGGVLALLLILINAASFFAQFNWLTQGSRILVGGLFIFSGFIKSNDPTGFAYKLEEYFDVFADDTARIHFLASFFHMLKGASLVLAIIVCLSEMALGFLLLIGFRIRLTLWLLLAQIVFFTFLTFYSACFNKVTHCGCFGDFFPLTPWQSFGKDLALMILITVLWIGVDRIKPVFGPFLSTVSTFVIILASIAFPVYAWYYLPPLDFRPYKPGKNIGEEMKPGPNYKQAVYEYWYKNKKTGDLQSFAPDKLPWKDSLTWAYDTAQPPKLVSAAVDEPKITDFRITDPESGEDMTDSILKNKDYYFLLVANELKETNRKVQGRINDFVGMCDRDKKKFYGLTSASHEEIRDFRHDVQAAYPYLNADQTLLKTMIRSNPGLILMKGCVVIANWPYHSFPSYTDVKTKYFNAREN
jgi:uncharacterized membrane protein YphA (DoxX/SURF4 family)